MNYLKELDKGTVVPERAALLKTDNSGPPAAGTGENGHGDKLGVLVGIGASAGGLQALKKVLPELPAAAGAAFVIVVHLSPEHESHLADILQPYTEMPVRQVHGDTALEPNSVYVIPPNSNLSSVDTHVRLSKLEEKRVERAPIDHFFETLSETHDGNAIGVVLSGMGSDGARGLLRIKERGGLTIAQDPAEAEYDGMPRAAIDSGAADLVLRAEEIGQQIHKFIRTGPQLCPPSEKRVISGDQTEFLSKTVKLLRTLTGSDFSNYRPSMLLRRIARRMLLQQIEQPAAYLKFLREHPSEAKLLADEFLINVTEFFRDPQVFEELASKTLPHLFEQRSARDAIRVWSVGCATGEEAYSLVILLLEEAEKHGAPPEIQVFATDLHQASLATAREGVYPDTIAANVSAERLERFFSKQGNTYRVRNEVREKVIFTRHNLLADPPFSRIDLISCRNLLIYLRREVQRDVVNLLHYALNPGGSLLLGTSESIEHPAHFRVISKKARLFQKLNVPATGPRLPVFPVMRSGAGQVLSGVTAQASEPDVAHEDAHLDMLEQFSPPSVLINSHDEVVHLSQHAGRYLQPAGGSLTPSIYKLVRDELRAALQTVLHTARRLDEPLQSRPVLVKTVDGERLLSVDVYPPREQQRGGYMLLIFNESVPPPETTTSNNETEEADGAALLQLENELVLTRKQLQATMQQNDTSEEELKTTNEELQSINEELRSMLEELETSKEELQSLNEELSAVNQENRFKVEELGQLNDVLQNLMAATQIATLFLDRNLRIIRFTPRLSELFNIRGADKGRPLEDLTHRLGYDGLLGDAHSVLASLAPLEREISGADDNWYLTRLFPYRSAEDRIEGVVITFVETTGLKHTEQALRESEARFRALIDASSQAVWTTDAEGQMIGESPSWEAYTSQTDSERHGSGWLDVIHPDDQELIRTAWEHTLQAHTSLNLEVRLKHQAGGWRWTLMRAVPVPAVDGVRGWVGMAIDIDEQKLTEETVRKLNNRLEELVLERTQQLARANEELESFNYSVSHDLRAPLRGIDGFSQVLLEDYAENLDATGRSYLQRISVGAGRMGVLIDDLLHLSRVSRTELRWTTVNLSALSTEITQRFQERNSRPGAEFAIEPGIEAQGDEGLLRIALTNLLENAWKFTAGQEQTRIEFGRDGNETPDTFFVRDNGVGFDVRYAKNIFAPFHRLHNDKDIPGTGVGLPLVQRIVALHGGSISAEGEVGKGAHFAFTLPARQAG